MVQATGLQPDDGDDVGASAVWVIQQASSLFPGVWTDESGVARVLLPPFAGRLSMRSSRKVSDGGSFLWEPGRTTEHVLTLEPL